MGLRPAHAASGAILPLKHEARPKADAYALPRNAYEYWHIRLAACARFNRHRSFTPGKTPSSAQVRCSLFTLNTAL